MIVVLYLMSDGAKAKTLINNKKNKYNKLK